MKYNIEELKREYRELIEGLDAECGLSRQVIETGYADDILYRQSRDAADHGEQDMEQYLSDRHAWAAFGATRLVFGFDNCDFIIKFQTEEGEMDYGAREAETYQAAVEANLGKYFANCFLLFHYTFRFDGTSYTVPVYAMERCDCSYDRISDDSYNYHYSKFCSEECLDGSKDETRDLFYDEYEDRYDGTDGMITYAMTTWSEDAEDWATLLRFICDWQINDLHPGNWGYNKNYQLVLTDYAGYGALANR